MASALQPYNRCTMQYFEKPLHAGDLQDRYTDSVVAEASESAKGARIEIALGLEGSKIRECRFRVFGCPHLIAAAEWLCSRIEGATLAGLPRIRVLDCMPLLAVPVEKTGRILLLEDAIKSLTAQLQET